MSYLLLMVLAITPPEVYVETFDLEKATYHEVLLEAIHNCPHKRPENINLKLMEDLINIEKEFNVPPEFRGMLLAAACQESGYNPRATGDRKFSKSGTKPMAIGLFQMWPWWESKKVGFGIDRTNYGEAARAWMQHIVNQIPKIKRNCGFKTNKHIWRAAWVTAIRYPTKNKRCWQSPNHLKLLKRWHRNIKIKRADGC